VTATQISRNAIVNVISPVDKGYIVHYWVSLISYSLY